MPSRVPRRWRGGARREARRPSIAPYRQAAREVCTPSRTRGMREAKPRTAPWRGGAMGTSRPTAKPHERGAGEVRTGRCARGGGAPCRTRGMRRGCAGRGAGCAGVNGEGNGGRARCPHRAARVMRVGNGGVARGTGNGAAAQDGRSGVCVLPACESGKVWSCPVAEGLSFTVYFTA